MHSAERAEECGLQRKFLNEIINQLFVSGGIIIANLPIAWVKLLKYAKLVSNVH